MLTSKSTSEEIARGLVSTLFLDVSDNLNTFQNIFSEVKIAKYFKIFRLPPNLDFSFLSAATLVAADYGFTCPPRFMSVVVVCLLFGMDKNSNLSAVRSPVELKLSKTLELLSQISMHVLVLRFNCYLYCKQANKKTCR